MAEKDRIISFRRRTDSLLYSPRADERLTAARAANKRARGALAAKATDWPANSPGSLNAWLLFVTTKPPVWRDPVLTWHDRPLALGEANESFFYPDPLGFWSENPPLGPDPVPAPVPHLGPGRGAGPHHPDARRRGPVTVQHRLRPLLPRVVLFLDEPSWVASGLEVKKIVNHYIKDPHRAGQVYEGFWGELEDGVVVGKSPQHPTTHKLYRADDMAGFLRSAPLPAP